jgi:galactokinase
LADRFEALTGQPPEGLWQAPGRVNLIGEHTDYNAGFALPFAIDRRTVVALRRRRDRQVRCWSSLDGMAVAAEVSLDALAPREAIAPWARYPIGVLWALEQAGVSTPGVDLVVDSTVPIGAGLSSSAALVAVAIDDVCDLGLRWRALVEVCHSAETEFVGAPVGRLDQIAVLCGRQDHGLMIDFRSVAVTTVALGPGPFVVVDTRVRHRNTDGAYAARRQACGEAAVLLGVPALRDATLEMVEGLDRELRRRARHVVSENERVLEVARRLRSGEAIGELLYQSHASLRDDFEVSCPELDTVVATAHQAGATGARLTGAGFGGSAIVLGIDAAVLGEALTDEFGRRGLRPPTAFAVQASDGAGRLT